MLAATEILQIREKLIKEMDVNRYEIVIWRPPNDHVANQRTQHRPL